MDIVNFWDLQTAKWSEDDKCGLCWAYGAPLTESALNLEQLEEDTKCCVHLYLTSLQFSKKVTFATTGFVNSESCEYSFTIYALKPSRIDLNNYTEIKGYSKETSKWVTVYEPIIDCLSCENVLDFCEILGYNVDIIKWDAFLVSNFRDTNYDGWKINATFRVKT